MNILVINNPANREAVLLTEKILNMFSKENINCEILAGDNLKTKNYDYVVTVGGDGTLLHAAHLLKNREIPIVGVNVGRLGFLTAITAERYEKLLALTTGDYFLENRLMLMADCNNKRLIALNEILIVGGTIAKTMDIEVSCDDSTVLGYRGDGVIVSTPTGSTAYALSAGGPIVDSRLGAISVTPLCAHSLGTPPMVFAKDRVIKVKTKTSCGMAIMCADGKEECKILDYVTIRCNNKYTPLIFFSKTGQFSAIEEKLQRK